MNFFAENFGPKKVDPGTATLTRDPLGPHNIFKGKSEYNEARRFIRSKFIEAAPVGCKIYTHFTIATDRSNVEKVFEVSADVIVEKNLSSVGMN